MKEVLERFIRDKVKLLNSTEIEEIFNCFEIRRYQKRAYFKEPFTIKEIQLIDFSGNMVMRQ